MRRRLEKRIYIPLPDLNARQQLIGKLLKNIPLADDVDIGRLALLTAGYSGADLQIICRDASMMPMRKLISSQPAGAADDPLGLSVARELLQLREKMPVVDMEDFLAALQNTRPSVQSSTLKRYEQWEAEFANK